MRYLLLIIFTACINPCFAQTITSSTKAQSPRIAIIMDDIGANLEVGINAMRIHQIRAYSFLPLEQHTAELANYAHLLNKEIILHLPMQALKQRKLGSGALELRMSDDEKLATIEKDIAAIPYVTGLNNHMGSLLTQHKPSMELLAQTAKAKHLFIIDSRTTPYSKLLASAKTFHVPSRSRDLFIDTINNKHFIKHQVKRMKKLAKKKGSLVVIAHPYPDTLSTLIKMLPQLEQQGFEFVKASDLIE